MTLSERAAANLRGLADNPYPGRGIIMGRTPDGDIVQIYWVMGRSQSSRNRILEEMPGNHGWVRTRVADPSGFPGDPSLLIYTAMAEENGNYIVSNGAQTDAVMRDGISVLEGSYWRYEPDSPNFTPRITGQIYRGGWQSYFELVMLRKSPFDETSDIFKSFYHEIAPGFGYFISTYEYDGNPLPSFCGEPQLLPIESIEPEIIAQNYWSVLNEDNRVALVVKVIPPEGQSKIAIINRHSIG